MNDPCTPMSDAITEKKWSSRLGLSLWEYGLLLFFALCLSLGVVGMFSGYLSKVQEPPVSRGNMR